MSISRINKRKDGLFFTIDALIAALVMMSGLLLITSSYISEQPRTSINHMSHDLLSVLSELHVYELNNTYVDELIANGTITNTNNTVIVQIGELWAEGDMSVANELTRNITEGLLPFSFGYSLIINNETIYARSNSVTNSLVSSKKIMSGIQKSKPVFGFVSKARATSIQKESNMVISFSPEGAGWDGSNSDKGFVYITKYFNLSDDVDINNASLYISLHMEDDGDDWNVININSGSCLITRDSLSMTEEGYFGIRDVSGCIVPGMNSVMVQEWNDGYNAHIHPGMYISISYNLTEDVSFISSENSERIYFDNILSVEGDGDGSGAWQMLPFHVPPGATNVSAYLYLNLQDITDLRDRYYWWGWKYRDAWDTRVYVNSDVTFYQDNPAASNDIDDCTWDSASCNGEYDWTGGFDISAEVIDGTNVVSVYVNNYGDTVGGNGDTVIYSDPINDPDNSSYVEINYTVTPVVPYGVVEIRSIAEFGGSPNPTKETSFSFPDEAVAISSVFAHVAEQYSYVTRVYGDTGTPPGNLVFESPSPRAVPTDVYVSRELLDVSEMATNYIRITETGGNDVLPESSVDYGFYVPSFVSFGDVFADVDEANEDAVQRLQAVMGNFVNVSNLILDNTSMSDVPSMWGPAVIEVRVWN
ncbi:hypothetical protein HQ545_05430 [Candidatus Woesearchaeota archaeon]|nr:hypothetical protein [Candidatus Woesearchaeota archaeon]